MTECKQTQFIVNYFVVVNKCCIFAYYVGKYTGKT
jgi:hypothetical protein